MKKRRFTIWLILIIVIVVILDIYYFISGPYNLQKNNSILKQKVEESLNVSVNYAYNYPIDEEIIVFVSDDTYYFYDNNKIFIEKPLAFFDQENFNNYVSSEYSLTDFKSGLSTYHQEAVKYAYNQNRLMVFDDNDNLILDFSFDNN